ncbi:MAG: ATP-binding protein [Candidatus Marinarcus sp.]|uniref:ATP-binding protein n=1 Tax=Candidatus Marinarcus sp. TaxID=3100987 RepID=UPI003B001B7D
MLIIKNRITIIIQLLILISLLFLLGSGLFLFQKIEDIQNNVYSTKVIENENRITNLISDKKNTTLTLALILSQDEHIKNALITRDFSNLKLDALSPLLKQYSDYKNVWIHIVSSDGISQYRSWTPQKGDSLLKVRKDIAQMIKKPQNMTTISVGRFDMTFKAMVPIFEDTKFLGHVEIISHFSSITKKLQQNGSESIILVDKKYKSQFKKPFTKLFIDDYYVANLYIKEDILNFMKEQGAEKFWNQDGYTIQNNYFISFHKEFNVDGELMATFVLFHNLKEIKTSQMDSFILMSKIIILSIFAISIFAICFIYFYLKKKEEESINAFLIKHNIELEERIELEIRNSRNKDLQLANQSKLVAMGEMIGNIAHQWRQPLSAISTAASGLQIKYEFESLNQEDFFELTNGIIHNTQYLSETIDDFRTFFKRDKQKDVFNIAKNIHDTYRIIQALYKSNDIQVIFELDNSLNFHGFKGELSQVFINILNNAKDILIERNIQEKVVLIQLFKKARTIVIEFHDNAGGVEEENNTKIFDPYFTTKHQSQGTGIGLYMSNEIITKHFNGKIYNENRVFTVDDTNHFGATMIIELPLQYE